MTQAGGGGGGAAVRIGVLLGMVMITMATRTVSLVLQLRVPLRRNGSMN